MGGVFSLRNPNRTRLFEIRNRTLVVRLFLVKRVEPAAHVARGVLAGLLRLLLLFRHAEEGVVLLDLEVLRVVPGDVAGDAVVVVRVSCVFISNTHKKKQETQKNGETCKKKRM